MTATDGVLEREVRIEADRETVFSYLVDPKKATEWMGAEVDLDPRPGGIYHVRISDEHVARGSYVEVVPPSRVVFTWGWEGDGNPVPPGSSTVELTLEPDGAATVVKLVHRGLPAGEVDSHGDGWAHYLGRLDVVAAGGDPGPDPWAA